MKALVNSILPREALEKLSRFAEPVLFSTHGIVAEPLAGHVDIFCAHVGGKLAVAPNIPAEIAEVLQAEQADWVFGRTEVSGDTKTMWAYNVLVDNDFCVCNTFFADPVLMEMLSDRKAIHVKQGFARCSAVSLGGGVITSDGGMAKVLGKNGISCILVSQEGISLPGYRNGCFGGACGICGDKIFITGSLKYHRQGEEIEKFIRKSGFTPIELCNEALLDVGSILFF